MLVHFDGESSSPFCICASLSSFRVIVNVIAMRNTLVKVLSYNHWHQIKSIAYEGLYRVEVLLYNPVSKKPYNETKQNDVKQDRTSLRKKI